MDDSLQSNVCRACLTDEGEFQSVFVADKSSGLSIHLAEMLMAYASVQITLGDGLPEQICVACAKKTVNLYMFKLRCEEADSTLRQRLGKSPLNEMYSLTEERLADDDPFVTKLIIKPEISADMEDDDEEEVDEMEHDMSPSAVIIEQDVDNLAESCNQDCETDLMVTVQNQTKHVVCDVCNRSFSRMSHLNRHKKIHSGCKQYICDICNKGFTRNDVLLRHLAMHDVKIKETFESAKEIKMEEQLSSLESILDTEIDEDLLQIKPEAMELKCISCKMVFITHEDYIIHMQTHGTKLRGTTGNLKCSECNKKFNKASHLTRHLKIHAAIKPYTCDLCNKGFARTEQLSNHLNAHTGVKPHTCDICNKGFNQVSNLKDHMRTHNGDKPFLCSVCGKGFNQLGNLRQHTIRHSGIKAHLCSTCGNGFASKGELCAHLRKHTGARPFVCVVCNHGFTTSSSLTKHKRIHSGEKPYECEVCKMKFSRSGILARHKRTHTGEKPYVCKFCTKAFSQSNDLSSHLRIHTGEKPYICDICGQAFRQSSALKTHKKTHIDRTSILEIERSRNFIPMIHSTFLNVLP